MSHPLMTPHDAAEMLGVTEDEIAALVSMQLLVAKPENEIHLAYHLAYDVPCIDTDSVVVLSQVRANILSAKAEVAQ